MVVRSLDAKKNPFQSLEEDGEILGPEVPYLSVIRALMIFQIIQDQIYLLQSIY
jgi:hypothetical protein